jgi:hypothetical protein
VQFDGVAGSTGVVAVETPDGRSALPVFTCIDAIRAWRPQARPLPVEAVRAALVAVNEGWAQLVVDPAGPVTVVVPRPAVWAIARSLPWEPAVSDGVVDAAVLAAVRRAAQSVPHVRAAHAEPGQSAEVGVVVNVDAGLSRDGLDLVIAQVNESLAGSPVIVERVDSIELWIRTAR